MPQKHNHNHKSLKVLLNQIVEPFHRVEEWKALQIPESPFPYAAVLFTGPPGTGKTYHSKHTLKRISGLPIADIPSLSMADVGDGKLGETEKLIKVMFKRAYDSAKKKKHTPVLFMDEVDAICWNRSNVSNSSMFMLSIVNTLLLEIDRFLEKGGAVFFATNHPEQLDPAFLSRITNLIELNPPTGPDAIKIWESLLPPPPFGISPPVEAATLGWTPREIKNWISNEARRAFAVRENMKWK